MKNKIKLFSLISALAIGATMSLTACGDNTVGEHDHVWGEPVITESTCHTEGKKTYSCEVEGCEQTKTEPIAKIAHSWDDGEVTKQAKCNEEGVKTYTCTSEGCEQTKTEPIEKTEHRYDDGQITRAPDFLINGIKTFTCLDCKEEKTQSVKAHADFSEQFYTALTEQNNWYYGYMTTFGAQMSEDDFVQITQMEGGVWKSGEIEIGKGYVCGDNAAIAYRFTQEMPEKIQTNVSISFSGEESTTRVKAYLIINGECIKTIEEDSNNWSKTEEAIDIAQGDTLCIVFKNAGEGKAGGNLTLTLTSPCVHVWDSGKITKAATCTEEGVKQYSCVSCDEKITETVEMIPHKYNNGEVTTEPTETSTGVRTYTCENCGNKKTEVIPATGSGKFEGADFAEDYELNESGEFAGWQVGVIDYQWSSETFDFTKISAHNENGDAYHSNDPWIDIKGDWMAVNGMMGFAYNFTSAANVKVQFNLHAVSENGKFSVRWAIKDKDGNIKNTDGKAQWYGDGHDIEFDQDITVVAGDVLYLLVNKDEGGDQNTFDLTLTNKDKQPAPEFEGANFYEDFSTEGNNGWVYGYASDYNWDNNNFTFNSLEKVSDEEWGGKSGIIIKRDWILSEWTEENQGNANAAIGYKVPAGQTKLDVAIKFDHAPDSVTEGESPTRYSVRLSVVGADGNTKSVEFINKGTSSWEATHTVDVADGDTVYVILFREADGWQQGKIQIVITEHTDEQPAPEFEGANFYEDFSTEGNNGWVYGYASDYNWDNNNFTFNSLEKVSGEEWGGKSGIIIKRDWILSEWTEENQGNANAAIGYKVPAGQTKLDVAIKFDHAPDSVTEGESPTRYSVRLSVVGADGNTKSVEFINKGTSSWEATHTVDVADGDTVYVILFREADGWQQGKIQITIDKA